MVFLAISAKGFAEAVRAASKTGEAVWCGADAVSEEEIERAPKVNVSRFVYGLQGENSSLIGDAVGTIAEHHPGETVWVEALKE